MFIFEKTNNMDRQQAIAIIKNEIYLAKLGERILTTRQLEKVLNYLENS